MGRLTAAVDYEDMKTGFMSGKTAALADWSFRKEQAAFKVLVNRLRARKWAKEHPARMNEKARVYQAKPGVRAKINERQKRHRFARWATRAGQGIACAECGVAFCEASPRKGPARKFCTDHCRWRLGAREHARRGT